MMVIRSKALRGHGKLTGAGLDHDVLYELMHRSEDIAAPHMDDLSAVVRGSTRDSITGRVKIVDGVTPAPGQKLVLTLEDGRKLPVLSEFDGKIMATGGFF
jgi:hypothetical protein